MRVLSDVNYYGFIPLIPFFGLTDEGGGFDQTYKFTTADLLVGLTSAALVFTTPSQLIPTADFRVGHTVRLTRSQEILKIKNSLPHLCGTVAQLQYSATSKILSLLNFHTEPIPECDQEVAKSPHSFRKPKHSGTLE